MEAWSLDSPAYVGGMSGRRAAGYALRMPTIVRLLDLTIPLRAPFGNAMATVAERRVVLVGIDQDGTVGWGEAAPYPGVTSEDAEEAWRALEGDPAMALDSRSSVHVTVGAAIEQAQLDLAARLAGIPLWQHIGGDGAAVPAAVAIGTHDTPAETADAAADAHEAGFRMVKVKIAPGRDRLHLEEVIGRLPDVRVAADANGAYRLDDPFFDLVDELGLAYLEQPLASPLLTEHAMLRARLETPVCLDESLLSVGSARRAISERSADVMCLKAGVLGPAAVAELIRSAVDAGATVKLGGLVETSVGRAHTLALATLPGVDHADLAPPGWFLQEDVSSRPWVLEHGSVYPGDRPGIGHEVNLTTAGGIVRRSAAVRVA